MVSRKQNEILRRNDYLIAYCFKIVAATIAGFLQIGVRRHHANAVLEKKLKCCLCFVLVVYWDEIHAQWENIKMSGCKTPCKALARTEYENRYWKNSKLTRFGGNKRSWFERVRQQFLRWLGQSDFSLLLPGEREIFFLIHSYSCGYGTFLSCAPVLMLCVLVPDVLQFASAAGSALPQPFAGEGAVWGEQGDSAAAGCVGRAGPMDSLHHMGSCLCL